ncbi:hypothetical protein MAR_002104, partial [Mya arenaria]
MASKDSSIYMGSDLIHDYSCSKCEENDLNTEALHFCPQCEHYLCGKCVRNHWAYFKEHVVYGRGEIQKWAGFSIDICEQHGKELEVHCDDHQEFCCSVCVALNHRVCNSTSHLSDLAKGFLKTKRFKQLPAAKTREFENRIIPSLIKRFKSQINPDIWKEVVKERVRPVTYVNLVHAAMSNAIRSSANRIPPGRNGILGYSLSGL